MIHICIAFLMIYKLIAIGGILFILILAFLLVINCIFIARRTFLDSTIPWINQFHKHLEDDIQLFHSINQQIFPQNEELKAV